MTEAGPESGKEVQPKAHGLRGLAIIAIVIPGMFWLGFGRVDGFAIGFTAFLVMLAAGVEYLPGLTEKVQDQGFGQDPALGSPWMAMAGVVWLLSIPLAPALTWLLRNVIGVDRGNWNALLGLTTLTCVVVPLFCALPLLRYVRRGTARYALAILAIGTGFPVAMGAGAAYDVVLGPAWQDVEIERLVPVEYMTGKGTQVKAEAAFVRLADGRKLSRARGVLLQPGPARLLVLRGIGRVIDAEQ